MKFYEIDNALQEAILSADKPVRVKIEIQCAGHFESVFEQDILEADFYGMKLPALKGGVSEDFPLKYQNNSSCFVIICL
jgi:hypothetical protein